MEKNDGAVRIHACLFINSRMFFANKFDWIDITITNGSKTIAKQRFTNIPLNLARNGGTGTVTFTFDQGTRVKNSNLQSGEVDFSDDWWYTYTY